MIATLPISYPYKLIYSYFINYEGTKNYDSIKKIVLNIDEPKSSRDILIKNMHIMILLAFNNKKLNVQGFISLIGKIFNIPRLIKIRCRLNILSELRSEELYLSCENFIKDFGIGLSSFALFVIASKLIAEKEGFYFILPISYFAISKDIENEQIKKHYLMGVIENLRIKNKSDESQNLYDKIKDFYSQNQVNFYNDDIKHIYLFGSIAKNQYHKESDIDMVIEFSESTSHIKINEIMNMLKEQNSKQFGRNTDAYEYFEFINRNPNLSLKQLF
ncbi:MAG: nucleotidyltransferase domain-containing protein [Bacilli bacterium]|nr:nucleotidyltransferase domain-containing protein [Erysipelotrichaceae bacterium]MDD7382383.1 nucleotidyltransferase domain-containing protein [Bacillales bacterium]MDY2745973.1 nucleotidyltransferase domain-containing protein [Bacilli bacterium]MDY3890656.1 nucleotidyltransferase domain-containing protein [Bacilli bacterium]MDY6142266.1 nucleotidyltransferase domain-containing protein [Bacilli bacterium]